MKGFCKAILFALSLSLFLVSCSQPEATPLPTPTPMPPTATATAVPTLAPTPTFTPSPEPTFTQTPTPAPLTPAQIFDQISPAVAFVDTPVGSGSGVLVEGKYVLTNAHVVWPFESVRLVFPDGSEFKDAPVFNVDLMVDLAVIGPLDTEIEPVPLVNGEGQVIGSDVYLIGYPGEVEKLPQPTITRGLISRLREWEGMGITYFQSDAAIAGGQSGGVLVDENAQVIGISGFYFTEAGFAVVASAADIWPRVQALMSGEDIADLGDWRLPTEEGRTSSSVILEDENDDSVFIIQEAVGTDIELQLIGNGDSPAYFTLTDIYGYPLLFGSSTNNQNYSTALELDAPYFVRVYQNSPGRQVFSLRSNTKLSRIQDNDDYASLSMGKATYGRTNYPGDLDYYLVYLETGHTINIQADSILRNPQVGIVPQDLPIFKHAVSDDNSGGGIFGLKAELTYEAPQSGFYTIIVESTYGNEMGGYILTMDAPYPGAPTPIAPTATPRPYETELGLMNLYTNSRYDFSFEYPGEWAEVQSNRSPNYEICRRYVVCFESYLDGFLLVMSVEGLSFIDSADMTTDEYVDRLIDLYVENEYSFISDETITTDNNLTLTVLTFESAAAGSLYTIRRMIYLNDGLAYNMIYVSPAKLFEDLEPLIEYSFESFRLE
ncbi:MAG TPA: serine protease [Chloroflexota bacterium]|nr:serine protease [Chloroflexota bacterium]